MQALRRHLPVVYFKTLSCRGWQISGQATLMLEQTYAAQASNKDPAYSIAISALIFPLMFYSDAGRFTRRPIYNRVRKMDACWFFGMQGLWYAIGWSEMSAICFVCVFLLVRTRWVENMREREREGALVRWIGVSEKKHIAYILGGVCVNIMMIFSPI